jgi:hypothetical protein
VKNSVINKPMQPEKIKADLVGQWPFQVVRWLNLSHKLELSISVI